MKAIPLALALLAALTGTALAQSRNSNTPVDCTTTMGALPESWAGTAFAIDGDTLAGVGLKPHIRIWGIQAPELRDKDKQETVPGMQARVALDGLMASGNNRVTCRVAKFDRYCRLVAQCIAPGPGPNGALVNDLGAGMLTLGLAYGFYLEDTLPWDAQAGHSYIALERAARSAQQGLWKTMFQGR